jgi:hypothetical protein
MIGSGTSPQAEALRHLLHRNGAPEDMGEE